VPALRRAPGARSLSAVFGRHVARFMSEAAVVSVFVALGLGAVVEGLLVFLWSPGFYRSAPRLCRLRVRGNPLLLQSAPELVIADAVNDTAVWRRVVFKRLSDTKVAFRESLAPTPRLSAGLVGLITEDSLAGVLSISTRGGWLGLSFLALGSVVSLAQGRWGGVVLLAVVLVVLGLAQNSRLRVMRRAIEKANG